MQLQYNTTESKTNEGLAMIQDQGGTFYTDNSFSFKGVEGDYLFESGLLTININSIPFLASESMIEDKVDEFFG